MSVRRSSKTISTQVAYESSSWMSSSGGIIMNGFGSSVVGYGSSGGYGNALISKSIMPSYEVTLCANDKLTMQNLNDRLASYLEKVRSLEKANSQLELQIKSFYENKSPMKSKDMSGYFRTISDLRSQILSGFAQNAELRLKLDNTRLAAEDFQIKYESEKNLRLVVDADLSRLQGVLGNIKLSIGDLESQHTGLKEELLFLKKNHEEDLHLLQERQSGSVNVEIDCAAQTDLEKTLQDLRVQYETLVEKKRKEVEQWYQSKVEAFQIQVKSSLTEIKTSQTELTDLKRTLQSFEIELQGLLTMKQQLQQSLADIGKQYADRLDQLQIRIDYLQEELQRLNANILEQASEYQLLLDIKMRLEMEIAEYRRLLDGEAQKTVISTSSSSMIRKETEIVTKTTEIKEEMSEEIKEVHNPHLQRRIKVIVEEIVDGQVVSTSVDEKVQDLN